jgi:hypothetical protein
MKLRTYLNFGANGEQAGADVPEGFQPRAGVMPMAETFFA